MSKKIGSISLRIFGGNSLSGTLQRMLSYNSGSNGSTVDYVVRWNEMPRTNRDYTAVMSEALKNNILNPEDVTSIEWGQHIRQNQIVYRVNFADGTHEIVFGSTDGTRFHVEGGSY